MVVPDFVVEKSASFLCSFDITENGFFSVEGKLLLPSAERFLNFNLDCITNPSASPGAPWVLRGYSTVSGVLCDYGESVASAVLDRLCARLDAAAAGALPTRAEDWVRLGLADPVRLFIKDEPHTQKKVLAEMWRLIQNTSAEDVMADRPLAMPIYRSFTANWREQGVKVGMGNTDDDIRDLCSWFSRIEGRRSSDVSGWDWSLLLYLFFATWRVLVRRAGVSEDSDWALLLRASFFKAACKLWLIAGDSRVPAHLVAARLLGVWETGSLWTAVFNSVARQTLQILVAAFECPFTFSTARMNARLSFAIVSGVPGAYMGDDAVESWDGPFPVEDYLALGFVVEAAELVAGFDVEFCSTWFSLSDPMSSYPSSWPKQWFGLVSKEPDGQLLAQANFELRHHPRREQLITWVAAKWGF